MKKKLLISTVLILIIGFISSIIINVIQYQELQDWEYLRFQKLSFVENIDTTEDEQDIELINEVEENPISTNELKVIGWIPDWDYEDGLEAVREQPDAFDSVSPFWFTINPDGSLEENGFTNGPETIAITRENDIELMPSIVSFNAATLESVLISEENTERFISSIVSNAVDYNYTGIDLDIESIYLRNNQEFKDFLKELSTRMIEKDKKLSFSVLPKWGDDDVVYLGFPETRRNLDYQFIANLVDEIRIMTYEYNNKNNAFYGPVNPLPWQEDVIRYAISVGVPREKIYLGVATFSYDYADSEKLDSLDYYPVLGQEFGNDNGQGLAYYNETIENIINEKNVDITFDEIWGEAIGKYTDDDNNPRILVYQTQESLDLRKELAAKYGIGGVAYWRIGDEGNLNY